MNLLPLDPHTFILHLGPSEEFREILRSQEDRGEELNLLLSVGEDFGDNDPNCFIEDRHILNYLISRQKFSYARILVEHGSKVERINETSKSILQGAKDLDDNAYELWRKVRPRIEVVE